jgi:hypothetical protein
MSYHAKLRHEFEKLRDSATPALIKYAGVLGDNNGNVLVPNRTNYNYCQVNGIICEVKNTRVAPIQGTPVMVGYTPDEPFLMKVIDVRSTDDAGNIYTVQTGYAPAARYQWMAQNGGEDPLFVELRQQLYGRLSCGVSGSPMAIQIVRNIVNTPSSASGWSLVDNPIKDMTSYVPAQSGSAIAVLVTAGSAGQIVLTAGSIVPVASLTIASIPQPPAGTITVYGAVRLYNGQTGIYEGRSNATDIVDLRYSGWAQSGAASSGHTIQVSGSSLASQTYLNFIPGSGVTITGTNNTGGSSTDITFTASASGISTAVYGQRADLWHEDSIVISGSPNTPEVNANQYYNMDSRQYLPNNGDTFTQSFMLASGTYTLSVEGTSNTTRGLIDWYIDNVKVVSLQDWYSASAGYNVVKTASVTVTGNGRHVLKGIINGHNASSVSPYYYAVLTKYWFSPSSDTTSLDAGGGSSGGHAIKVNSSGSFAQQPNLNIISVNASGSNNTSGSSTDITINAREILSADRTYYVATNGSDSNNGLTSGSAGAFLTIQKAINIVSGTLDIGIYNVTIQVADGTYVASDYFTCKDAVGSGNIIVQGNASTPASVVIDGGFYKNTSFTTYFIKNLKLNKASNTGSSAIWVLYGANIQFSGVIFGVNYYSHVNSSSGGICSASGNYTISGNANYHWLADFGSFIQAQLITITLTGTPAFSGAFTYTGHLSNITCSGNTFSGGANGQRYSVNQNSVIETYGGGANYLPGNSPGGTGTGGIYE